MKDTPTPTVHGNGSQIRDITWGSFLNESQWELDGQDCENFSLENKQRRLEVNTYAYTLLKARKIPPIFRVLKSLTKLFSAISLWYFFDRRRGRDSSRRGISRRLRKRFVSLGSTYIKLGQIISSGEGLFPEQLVDEFKLLRDQVPPEKYIDVQKVIEEDFSRPIESIFSYFERDSIAAASIAQVHRAQLITGEKVIVKVQRPKVKQLVTKDISVLAWLAPRLVGRIPVSALANPPALVEIFAETIIEELDFRLEADNMIEIARVLAETNQREIIVPRPRLDLVTQRVLVMEEVKGFHFDEVDAIKESGIDTKKILSAGLVAFAEGALIHGVFHGDLHSGNLFILEDGTTALLDFGITGRLNEIQRRAFMRLIIAGMSGNAKQQIESLRDLGAFPEDIDVASVVKDLDLEGPVKDPTKMSSEQLAFEMNNITKKLLGYGARAPKELMLFAKNLIFLDGATASLAPDLDVLSEIQRVYAYIMKTHGGKILSDLGMTSNDANIDMDAVRLSFGISDNIDSLTYEDILKRRDLIRKRMGTTHD